MSGLLSGVKVIDLTRVLAGPYCGMMLADMGADVIKIELPGKGDDSRANPPFLHGESAYFMNLNRNKKGMTLNLKHEKGKDIFLKLVKECDIVIENYRPGVMERLGLGYDTLREINPAIVYGCISGFGHYGPYSGRAGYDIIGQAMSGLMSTTGWPDSPPTRTGTAIADVMGGISCCTGILAAYTKRLKTGIGDKVDVSIVDAMVSSMEIINMIYLCEKRTPQRIGNRYEAIYPYDTFQAQDGMVVIACGNDKLFNILKEHLQIEALNKPEYQSNLDRVRRHAEIKPMIEMWTKSRNIDDIVEQMLAVGIPSAPVNTIDRVLSDPHIAVAREMFVDLPHPVAGAMKVTGNPLKFTNNKVKIDKPSPTLSEDTQEILHRFCGIDEEEFEKLKHESVI